MSVSILSTAKGARPVLTKLCLGECEWLEAQHHLGKVQVGPVLWRCLKNVWVVHGAEVLRSVCDPLNLDRVATLPELMCLFVLQPPPWLGKVQAAIHVYEQRGC